MLYLLFACISFPLLILSSDPLCTPNLQTKLIEGWEAHLKGEFGSRDVSFTLGTMLENGARATVNHVPTAAGGFGVSDLSNFYSHNFIFDQGEDVSTENIGRVISADCRVIFDELIFSFTHDRVLDWILPNVSPTFRKVSVYLTVRVDLAPIIDPISGIVDKFAITSERINWDQGTVMKQIGLLDNLELPVLGVLTAQKAKEPNNRNYPYNVLNLVVKDEI